MSDLIQYFECALGFVEITADDQAVTAMNFREHRVQPENPGRLTTLAALQLQAYFEGTLRSFNFPIKQQGSQFQQSVWKLLEEIPFGKTISYRTLSQQYGDPKAIRAVAAANGRNQLAIVVPCHRVIGSDHSLTGYAGGLWRKKWLLEHEAKFHAGVIQHSLFGD